VRRRPEPAVLVSIALHVVLGAALARVLMDPGSLPGGLAREKAAKPAEERITYVAVAPRASAAEPGERPRSGGDGRPEDPRRPTRPARPIPVPEPVTPGVPAPSAESNEGGGSGSILDTPGPLRGVAPTYADPRVWAPPGPVVVAPKTPAQKMDSLVNAGIQRYNDSLAVAANQRKPGDWTVERNGKRYGLDRGRLVLGDFSVPIPFALQAPISQDMERDRVMARVRAEIEQQSRRAMNEEEFRTAVRRIRERKERERANSREPAGGEVATPQ
jgi:hypothetical protein